MKLHLVPLCRENNNRESSAPKYHFFQNDKNPLRNFTPVKPEVFNLGFANPQGFTRKFLRVLGWQLSFHVLLLFNILH